MRYLQNKKQNLNTFSSLSFFPPLLQPTKKQQKQDAEAKAKHVETFGGDFDGYDSSHDQVYDDFM